MGRAGWVNRLWVVWQNDTKEASGGIAGAFFRVITGCLEIAHGVVIFLTFQS